MAKNEARRQAIADAGIAVLAREGSRGLTHRAVDGQAGVPAGTTSNYFRSRDALIDGLVERIGERLMAPPEELERRASEAPPGRERFTLQLHDLVSRLLAERDASIALIELRLEAGRRPELAERLTAWQRAGLDAETAFNVETGLPARRREIALLHYAVDGILLDRLTTSIDPDTPVDRIVDDFIAAILPPE